MANTRQDTHGPEKSASENRDPISGEKGSHPVGTGLGAAATGAAAGAAGGAMAGPVGAAVGAVVGAVAGGLAGKGIAESVNPTAETEYWRSNYKSRPYVESGHEFEAYEPAYRYGWESRVEHSDKDFEQVESDLGRSWDKARGQSKLTWDKARPATRDAWDRLDQSLTRKG
jgi:phage tail tape-measure protein